MRITKLSNDIGHIIDMENNIVMFRDQDGDFDTIFSDRSLNVDDISDIENIFQENMGNKSIRHSQVNAKIEAVKSIVRKAWTPQ